MMNSYRWRDFALFRPEVQEVLNRLHTLADTRDETIMQQVKEDNPDWKDTSPEERATMCRGILVPVSRDTGRFLYSVARSISARQIIEFGTSYGVSAIYLAAAVRDNGGGLLVGTELETSKVAKAVHHLAEAGLSQMVEIRAGDARETLKHIDADIDLLFLDGWKELYLDVLHLLSGSLRAGSVILADDLDSAQLAPYLDYVRNPANGFVSVMLPLDDGIEYSVKL
jgi:predicted O-methyltransferase YrrM